MFLTAQPHETTFAMNDLLYWYIEYNSVTTQWPVFNANQFKHTLYYLYIYECIYYNRKTCFNYKYDFYVYASMSAENEI